MTTSFSGLATSLFLIAQDGAGAAADGAGAAGGGEVSPWNMLVPMVLILPLFYLMIIRPERRKQAAAKTLLEGMKKSDRVVTAGGVKGVISNINRNSDEVTLVVDESSGTKMRFTIGSIVRVETDESGDSKK